MQFTVVGWNYFGDCMNHTKKVFVFSIALNGYQWRYRSCINSHRAYCQKHGFDYTVITRPTFTRLGAECCWLKLYLIEAALNSGHQRVLFLDADAYVQPQCPDITQIEAAEKDLYLANGFSGELNSGVMYFRNTPQVRQWLQRLLANSTTAVAETSLVGWGENAHVIHFAKGYEGLKVITSQWNNTFDENADDYIRHFSCGPLQTSLIDKMMHKLLFKLSKLSLGCDISSSQSQHSKLLIIKKHMPEILAQVTRIYPGFISNCENEKVERLS